MPTYNKRIGQTNSQTTKDIVEIEQRLDVTDASIIRSGGPQINTWYVNLNGSDIDGDGKPSNPFQSISKAITEAESGDTIIIYPGIYSESLIIDKSLHFVNWNVGSDYTITPVSVMDAFITGGLINFKGISFFSASNSVNINSASPLTSVSLYESSIPVLNVGHDVAAGCDLKLIECNITTLNITTQTPTLTIYGGNIINFNGNTTAGTVSFSKTLLGTLNLDGYSGSAKLSNINTLQPFTGTFTVNQSGIFIDNHTGVGAGTLTNNNPWGAPSKANQEHTGLTTAGNDVSTGIMMANTPSGATRVLFNGRQQIVGDQVTTKDCYFSPDGIIIRAIEEIVVGDWLFWNGNNAGFDIDPSDYIALNYNV